MKKFLSVLLAAMMIISLIPAVAAADTTTYTYTFKNEARATFSDDAGTSHTFGNYDINDYAMNEGYDEWKFVNVKSYTAGAVTKNWLNWGFKTTDEPVFNQDGNPTAAIAFEVVVPTAGTYVPTLTYRAQKAAPNVEVYLVEKAEFDSLTGNVEYYRDKDDASDVADVKVEAFTKAVKSMSVNDRLGQVNMYAETTTLDVPEDFDNRNIVVDEANTSYVLVIVPNGASVAAGTYNVQPQSFALTKIAEPETGDADTGTSESIEYDLAKVTALKNSGSSANLTQASANDGTMALTSMQVRRYGVTGANGPLMAIPITVTEGGTYSIEFKTNETGVGTTKSYAAAPAVYVVPNDGTITANSNLADIVGGASPIGYFDFSSFTAADTYATVTEDGTVSGTVSTKELAAGNYFIVLYCDATSLSLNNTTSQGDVDLTVYDCDTSGVRTIAGDTALGATYYQRIYLAGIKLTSAMVEVEADARLETAEEAAARLAIQTGLAADENLTSDAAAPTAGTTTALAAYLNGGELDGTDIVSIVDGVATAENKTGYTFLYWKKALTNDKDRILSFSNEYNIKALAGTANTVIAVYEAAGTDGAPTAKFYNYNGELIETIEADESGSVTTPALPTLTGYTGSASAWAVDEETTYGAGESVTITEDTVFVAQYDESAIVTYTITVPAEATVKVGNEEAATGATSYTANYGDKITVTMPARGTDGYSVFNYMKKGEDIVSFKTAYTFYANESCTFTASYNANYEPINKTLRKIITKAVDGTLMAEFIGFEDATEKGVIVGGDLASATHRLTMNTNSSQLAVGNEDGLNVKGYAILDGVVYYGE